MELDKQKAGIIASRIKRLGGAGDNDGRYINLRYELLDTITCGDKYFRASGRKTGNESAAIFSWVSNA